MSHASRRRWRRATTSAATAALLCGALLTFTSAPAAAQVRLGSGSYTTVLPPGASGPSDHTGAPVAPKVTADFTQPVVTNDWWSSLIFQRYPGNPYGENLYAHPLSFKAQAHGLEVGYPDTPELVADGLKYQYTHSPDFVLGIHGLNAPAAKVAGYSDWTVTADLSDGTRQLRTTIGQGLPFVYANVSGGPIRVEFTAPPTVWRRSGNAVGVTVNGHHYALFAPSGTTWSESDTVFTADVGGSGYASVALLPSPDDFDRYAPYAYSFVTSTTLTYDYDPASATLTSTYRVTTEAREGTAQGTLLALYPHQWKETTTALTDLSYASPRGPMRVVEGDRFTTELTTHGILPSLPTVDSADHQRLRALIDAELHASDPWKGASDTYWTGKALGRSPSSSRSPTPSATPRDATPCSTS